MGTRQDQKDQVVIHRIFSDLPTFKELLFNSGLNIILAERSQGASERQTRNGAGKTSLIELVHFLMGGNVDAKSLFKKPALNKYLFAMDFDLGNTIATVSRKADEPSEIQLASRLSNISNERWKAILGESLFSLGSLSKDGAKYIPTFRSLFSYFARRQEAGGFSSPFKHSSMQQLWDSQVAISYLLDLDWTLAQEWEIARQREEAIKHLKKALQEGTLGFAFGRAADLRTRLALAEQRTNQLKQDIQNFRVLPRYNELEKESSQLNRQLSKLLNENVSDRELLANLQQATQQEFPPSHPDLESLYGEIGIVLPALTLRRFEDVKTFHKSVIENRKSYLEEEIVLITQRINQREQTKQQLEVRQSYLMTLLGSHGALEQYNLLSSDLGRLESEVENVRQQLALAERIERDKVQADIERNNLYLSLSRSFQDQKDSALKNAIVTFEEISKALYEDAGSLTVDETANGPKFEVSIQGSKSKGISNMQIFCFDMMLMRLCVTRSIGPRFLIHDSHMFDGVDERQISKALQVGAELAEKLGFQYIVTLNSDIMPNDAILKKCILDVQLTDALETGGLFGVRFN